MAIRFSVSKPGLQKFHRHKSFHLLCGLAALTVLVRLSMFVVYEPYYEGDTDLLVKSHINAIRACLGEGRFSGCSGSGVFPLLQNVPSLILNYLGFSPTAILHALAYLSFVSFLGSGGLLFWILKRKASPKAAATGVLVLITGPLLWYSHSTFGEMASAFLILAFTAASLLRARGGILVLLFVLAGSTKEVALPFLLVIGVVCLMPEIVNDWRKVRKRVGWLAAGAILTLVVTAGFNYFRFGSFLNPSYVTEPFIVPTLRIQLSFFLGIWLSPNGGLLFFWPSFTFLYLALLVVLVLRFLRDRRGSRRQTREALTAYLPIAAISVLLLFLTLGFSRWYTPLGGFAWGPRYMLPWIPTVTLMLIYFYQAEIASILSAILIEPLRFILTCVVLILVSIPQLTVLFDSSVMARIFAYPECPRIPVIQKGVAYYYQCLQTQLWPKSLRIAELYPVAFTPPFFWFVLLYAATLIWICHSLRRAYTGETELRTKPTPNRYLRVAAVLSTIRIAIGARRYHVVLVVISYALLFFAFFSPVLYAGSLLAAGGDGLYIYLPNYYSSKVLWDTLLFSGFPMMADPQVLSWYPPAFLLSQLPGTWNVFILLAYVAASAFTYGYVHTLTASRLAALFSGIVFGLSGFMIAHLGHAVIIHAAAWIPLIVWSLEELRHRWRVKWFVAGSVAVASSCLGGHSQICAYGLLLSVAYLAVVGWNAPTGRWRYYILALAMIVVGLGLAAVQIIPTAELLQQSTRVAYSFRDFVSHSLPPRQALTMIFPNVFGGVPESGLLPYFGAVNQTELTGYVGLMPLVLAAVSIIATRRRSLSLFWLAAGLLAFLLAMGDATPLARLTYNVPIINQFRAPARHLIELSLAVSVLSGLGLAALQRRTVSPGTLVKIGIFASLTLLVCMLILFLNSDHMAGLAAQRGIAQLHLAPWANRAVGVQVVLFFLGITGLIYLYKQPSSLVRCIFILLILVIDLGSFGWFYEWRYAAPDRKGLTPPAIAERFKTLLNAGNQRLLPTRGAMAQLGEIPPNLSRVWGVPSASGYNALILSRFSRLTNMQDVGTVTRPLWLDPRDQSLDLAAVRYLFMSSYQEMTDERGITWQKDEMQLALGANCVERSRDSVSFNFPTPISSTAIAIVARLACASQIPDGAEVVQVRITDSTGQVVAQSFVAGRDASEWAYDCNQVKPFMKHKRAEVFSTHPIKLNDESCVAHSYVTKLNQKGGKDIKSIELKWVGSSGSMLLDRISLIDDHANASSPLDPMTMGDRWRFVEETDGARVYENLTAQPRVWLVPEVVMLGAEEALLTAKTSRLPDGRDFAPERMAIVEEPLTLVVANPDYNAVALVGLLTDNGMEVHTSSSTPAFLVTSDVYYPGWRASIDGQEAKLYQANYALRGVAVPAGHHVVKFEYRPRRFLFGAALSLLSLTVLGALAFRSFSWRKLLGAVGNPMNDRK